MIVRGTGHAGRYMLVHQATGQPVSTNEMVDDFRGSSSMVMGGTAPQSPSSTGSVLVAIKGGTMTYYPSVYNLEWRRT